MVWDNINPQVVVQSWLQGLPLKGDEKEAQLTNAMLASAVGGKDAFILGGDQFLNVPEIVRVFTETCAASNNSSWAHPDTLTKIPALLKGLCTQFPMASSSLKLSQHQQQVLSSLVE